MHPTHNDLPAKTREKVTRVLNQLLADSSDLAMQAKQAHWNVRGPSFIALHRLFDEVYEHAAEWSDEIAERVAQVGGQVHGTLQAAAKSTRLKPYPLELVRDLDHVEMLASAIAKFGAGVRAAIETFSEIDQDTADLCTEISRAADKDLWFVEAHLGGKSARAATKR